MEYKILHVSVGKINPHLLQVFMKPLQSRLVQQLTCLWILRDLPHVEVEVVRTGQDVLSKKTEECLEL